MHNICHYQILSFTNLPQLPLIFKLLNHSTLSFNKSFFRNPPSALLTENPQRLSGPNTEESAHYRNRQQISVPLKHSWHGTNEDIVFMFSIVLKSIVSFED